MTCKHNWNFVDGLTKRIRCIKCAAMQFTYNKEEMDKLTVPDQGYALANSNLAPSRFIIMDGGTKEVMRIDTLGITVNPEFPVDEAAKHVIKALDQYVKAMVQKEYERGVIDGKATAEESSAVQEPVSWGVDWGKAGDVPCVSIIKRKVGGSIEVVAVEYAPYTVKEKK